ncbi:TetR family transcriptional regulator [Nocardioides sp. JQ2195]|uniref:TetR/AcrR family transcriptional regulator n=1 Tax=Nocardioides sp. JQ2195 TaxID=2592334 RepID=UPI00143E328C|nr:TetR family transcriptional regulator [Nocardioides sp. JQ2195]QIX25188.1 TetR family transcriptional regulator [Nocardioides sp. JQ2195]
MTESANSLTVRKVTTAHRITVCAQQLTDQHGFDGFTMDELAEAAGVSRRTVFNYFPGKLDAVLGNKPEVRDDLLTEFTRGGPEGNLIDDLCSILVHMVSTKEFTRAEAEVARRIVKADPRLMAAAHERFEGLAEEFAALIVRREGEAFGNRRARLLISMVACLYGVALNDVLDADNPGLELDVAFVEALSTLRDLLSR